MKYSTYVIEYFDNEEITISALNQNEAERKANEIRAKNKLDTKIFRVDKIKNKGL